MATSIGVPEFWDSLDDSQRNDVLLVHKVGEWLKHGVVVEWQCL
jgi:hypothetical protein